MAAAASAALRTPAIRAMRAKLLDLNSTWLADITIVAGDDLPEVIMFNGDPFLIDTASSNDCLFYQQVRPFHAIGA